ncbi:MAG: UDP-N-acetylmuramate dehydrogenase [Betaproteobacteria bacterium]|nr:UDP-N-acetylmuramate dehydrogenase [Betaproteobacteria bacterium]
MQIEEGVSLTQFNTFRVPARALALARITADADVRRVLDHPHWGRQPKFVLGGGSNLLLTRDLDAVVLKVEVMGRRIVHDDALHTVVEAGAGEPWHAFVQWTLEQGAPGLENLALIPGTVGAAPVQNIGAYGVELQDRFHSLDAVDLVTGRSVTLDPQACRFGYRDSIFKRALAGKSLITRVRFALPKPWRAVADYRDVALALDKERITQPSAQQIFELVCAIRRAKLPDPADIGNAGSFFKNPVVDRRVLDDVLDVDGNLVYYPLDGADHGKFKLAAGWLIDACGWKGRHLGDAGVYDKQALVLVNRGQASGQEILELAHAIQRSVRQRFGIALEPEPVIV